MALAAREMNGREINENEMNACEELHTICASLKRFRFPFDDKTIPLDGIYVLFEKGETGHSGERIVRIGSHTGVGQLRSRLLQHFVNENKDRSIFRKNIGRCILLGDAYATVWELDMTTKDMREKHGAKIDTEKQAAVEKEVSAYIQDNFSFVVFGAQDTDTRLALEASMIATVAQSHDCFASSSWLGKRSPVKQIREGKLWLVQHLDGAPLTETQLTILRSAGIR